MNQIFIIGDSTVTDNTPPFRGWGWALPDFVRDDVKVFNHAESGCSTRSTIWPPIPQEMISPIPTVSMK